MKDESDAALSEKKTSTTHQGKPPGSPKKPHENIDLVSDELELSEDESLADNESTKRSPPSSAKKTDTSTSRKRAAEDEPFDDRTNKENDTAAETNTDDGEYLFCLYSLDFILI